MSAPLEQGWSLADLALAIGFRAMGEDYTDIAMRLDRRREDVVRTLGKARALIRQEVWLQPLMMDPPTCRADEPDKRVDRFHPRRFRVVPNVRDLMGAQVKDVTAELMGDPKPYRSIFEERN